MARRHFIARSKFLLFSFLYHLLIWGAVDKWIWWCWHVRTLFKISRKWFLDVEFSIEIRAVFKERHFWMRMDSRVGVGEKRREELGRVRREGERGETLTNLFYEQKKSVLASVGYHRRCRKIGFFLSILVWICIFLWLLLGTQMIPSFWFLGYIQTCSFSFSGSLEFLKHFCCKELSEIFMVNQFPVADW